MIILPVILVITSEHIGHQVVTSKIVGRDLLKDPGLHRSLFGDNFSTMLSGCIGSVPTTAYGEKYRRHGGYESLQRARYCGRGRSFHRMLFYRQTVHFNQHDPGPGHRRDFLFALRYDWHFGPSHPGGFQSGLRQFQESGADLRHICDGSFRNQGQHR